MEPWGFTLQELAWRYRAVRLEEWDRVAWACWQIPRQTLTLMFGKQAKRIAPADLNPLRAESKQVKFSEVMNSIQKAKEAADMPQALSNAEKEKRWRRLQKRET